MASVEEEEVTALDLVAEEEQSAKEAAYIASKVDLSKCSYERGYVSQPVYSCLTCHDEESSFFAEAGFCLSCSVSCHVGHNVVEIGTRRNFKCDCGNKKFGETCSLFASKEDYNDENEYSHNFGGLFCRCNSGYEPSDTMINCNRCHEWIHDRCLQPPNAAMIDTDSDFYCMECVRVCPFLLHYSDVGEGSEAMHPNKKLKLDDTMSSECIMPSISDSLKVGKDLFLDSNWRDKVCKCSSCVLLYKDAKSEFLLVTDENEKVSNEILFGSAMGEESGEVNNIDNVLNGMIDGMMSKLPIAKVVAYKEKMDVFFKEVKDSLREISAQNGGKAITPEDIVSMFKQISQKSKR